MLDYPQVLLDGCSTIDCWLCHPWRGSGQWRETDAILATPLVAIPLHFQWAPLLQVPIKDGRGVMGIEGVRNQHDRPEQVQNLVIVVSPLQGNFSHVSE
jgi:hypothetical protein